MAHPIPPHIAKVNGGHYWDKPEAYSDPIWAMRYRARTTHELSLLHVFVLRMSVAIAVFCVIYFAAEFLR